MVAVDPCKISIAHRRPRLLHRSRKDKMNQRRLIWTPRWKNWPSYCCCPLKKWLVLVMKEFSKKNTCLHGRQAPSIDSWGLQIMKRPNLLEGHLGRISSTRKNQHHLRIFTVFWVCNFAMLRCPKLIIHHDWCKHVNMFPGISWAKIVHKQLKFKPLFRRFLTYSTSILHV